MLRNFTRSFDFFRIAMPVCAFLIFAAQACASASPEQRAQRIADHAFRDPSRRGRACCKCAAIRALATKLCASKRISTADGNTSISTPNAAGSKRSWAMPPAARKRRSKSPSSSIPPSMKPLRGKNITPSKFPTAPSSDSETAFRIGRGFAPKTAMFSAGREPNGRKI